MALPRLLKLPSLLVFVLILYPFNQKVDCIAFEAKSAWCYQIPITLGRDVMAGCPHDLANMIENVPDHPLREDFEEFYCQCENQMSGYEMCKYVEKTHSNWCCGPVNCARYFMGSTYNATVRGWPPDCGEPNPTLSNSPVCPEDLYSMPKKSIYDEPTTQDEAPLEEEEEKSSKETRNSEGDEPDVVGLPVGHQSDQPEEGASNQSINSAPKSYFGYNLFVSVQLLLVSIVFLRY